MFKELKWCITIKNQQIKNLSETENVFKSSTIEMKNLLEGLNRRFYMAEERISELEDRAIKIIHSEEHRGTQNKTIEEEKNRLSETCKETLSMPICVM